MERVVTETVEFVHLTLVDGVGPVYFKQYLSHRSNTVDVFIIECNDTGTEDVGDVQQRGVFVAFPLKFSCQ